MPSRRFDDFRTFDNCDLSEIFQYLGSPLLEQILSALAFGNPAYGGYHIVCQSQIIENRRLERTHRGFPWVQREPFSRNACKVRRGPQVGWVFLKTREW